jgi:hypothetical protein
MALNLYTLYSKPSQLIGYDRAYDTVPMLVLNIAKTGKKLNPAQIKTLATNVKYAYMYASDILDGRRFPEGEKAIAGNAMIAYQYARDVIKGRFPEGEAAIATDPQYAYYYARMVLEDRFPEGEAAIATHPGWAFYYASQVIRGRWPEGEKVIKGSKWENNYREVYNEPL